MNTCVSEDTFNLRDLLDMPLNKKKEKETKLIFDLNVKSSMGFF